MTADEAAQIATLLNNRNELEEMLTANSVRRDEALYDYIAVDGKVQACIQRKELQWYQWEVLHLSVLEELEGKGVAYKLYQQVENRAIARGIPLFQCTIREGNVDSETFFRRQGFVKVNQFENRRTGNVVGVWQKVL